MSILSKILTLFRGAATEAGQSIVDQNAVRILDQEIRDAQNESVRAKDELARMMAQQKLAADRLQAKQDKKAEYENHIQGLLAKGDQNLAREVATKVAQLEGEIASEQKDGSTLVASIEKMRDALRTADRRITGLQQQVDQVKVNESVLRSQSAIAARHSGQNAKLRTALDSLDRIKTRQAEQTAQIAAADELAASEGDGDLEARLAKAGMLPGSTSADDVLARFQTVSVTRQEPAQLSAPASAAPASAVSSPAANKAG
jgi:phage shock protein A